MYAKSQKKEVIVFRPTTRWLKSFLIKNNYTEIAAQIDDDWCWMELGVFAKNVSQKVLDLVTAEIIKSGDGWACYRYCLDVEDRDDVREAMINSGNGWACREYCYYVKDRDDVREIAEKGGYSV